MSEEKPAENQREKNKHHERYKEYNWNKDNLENNPPVTEDRKCRDIICCLIFIAFIAGMVVVTILGFSEGNPDLVLYPYDDDGNQCGRTSLVDYPYLYFYEAVSNLKDYNTSQIVQGVCVKNCPTEFTGYLNCSATSHNPNCTVTQENFYVSVEFLQRFCVPDPTYTNSTSNSTKTVTINGTTYQEVSSSNQASATSLINLSVFNTDKLVSWMTDLITCWPIILASLGFSIVIAIIYMVLIRCCAGVIAYTTILLILGTLTGLGYLFQDRAYYYKNIQDTTYENTMWVLCCIFYSLAGIWLLIIVFMCNRIRLAIALVEVTAEYMSSTWSVYIIPFIFYILSGFFYAYWVSLSIYLYSSGTVSKSSSSFIPSVTWTSTTRYAWWYHLFALFYINAFINAYNQFVTASSAVIWYFEHNIEGGPTRPVSRSFYRGLRYHIGSLAFGALIVAIIRFMMAVVEYIKQKLDATHAGKTAGKIYNCLLTCCQCCLECIARIVEFINKHAYIQIAIKGESFCTSAFEGFGLVFRNLGRWSMLFLIGSFFNFIGMLFISSGTGLVGYLLITRITYYSQRLYSPVLPTMVMGFIGFVVGVVCMSIYGTSGDAMMHCFLYDEELHNKNPKFTPVQLQKFIDEERN